MKFYGDIELIGKGNILNLIPERVDNLPTFIPEDEGRILYDNVHKIYKFNNGSEYIELSLPANFSNLITVLGNNWITGDYTFNPTDFNSLDSLDGLTSNNSLFDVIAQLDKVISDKNVTNIVDLDDVNETVSPESGFVLYYNGTDYTFSALNSLIQNYGNIEMSYLKDYDNTNLNNNSIIVYNNVEKKYKSQLIYETFEDLTSSAVHIINHNLGLKYCTVTVIDRSIDSIITDAIVKFEEQGIISITLAQPKPISVILSAFPI